MPRYSKVFIFVSLLLTIGLLIGANVDQAHSLLWSLGFIPLALAVWAFLLHHLKSH